MNTPKKIIFILLILFPVFSGWSFDDVRGVISFNQNDYLGARQNWSVCNAGTGYLYFANHTGLLVFDGTNWKLNNLPNQTILRCAKAQSDSLIYTGGYMEMGFWKKDENGDLSYTSLNPEDRSYFPNNIEFWNIGIRKDFVYFQAFSKILAYHNDSVAPVTLEGQIAVMNEVNGKILVALRNRGIYEIDGYEAHPFIENELLTGKLIKFIIPFKNNQLLVGTAAHGIFLWDGTELHQWNQAWTDYFIKNELNRAKFTENGKVIVGTLIDGIVVFDESGTPEMKLNSGNGLLNNTVLGIDTDDWGNIWLALDVGIGFVAGNQNRSFSIEKLPGTGAIYSTAIFENKLYLGTNQGLFEKSLDPGNPEIHLVPQTQDQIWELKVFDDELLVGHNQGTFVLKNGTSHQISTESGGFNFIGDPLHPELILQSTYNNLVVFNKTPGGIIYRNKIDGFADLIQYIEFDHVGNIWASHMHRGIYKLTVDDDRKRVLESNYYGAEVFGKENFINVFKIENRIVFTTGEKIYTYDDLQDSIVEYEPLMTNIGDYKTSHRIIPAPNHNYWFIGTESMGLFSIVQDEVKLIKEFPTSLFNDLFLVEGFENLLPLNEYSAMLCLQNGIAYLDASITNPSGDEISKLRPSLQHIELRNNREEKVLLPLNTRHPKIKHSLNNLFFRFSFPLISDLPVYYQYRLEGLDAEWSGKTRNSQFSLIRLPRGKYTLNVKAVDSWNNESQVYSLPFEVLPPLFASRWAILFYTVFLIGLLLLFRMWGIRQTRKREKHQHEEREKELIRLRNEKLQAEVSHKSKELANSTMGIIKKNEFLLDLKKIIQNQKSELGSRYPDKYVNYLNKKIDENISNRDDWQVFETNFERAHEQFFKKMKEKFPELTPSDLQLSAYLRMNLSSKEIAPLLGISVRGVENHRYRLRKKMNIEHDNSLIDVILGL